MEDNFLKVAKQAALEAGKIIQKYQGSFGDKFIKEGDKSNFATKADIESEKKIISILKKYFPDHNIIAEEGGEDHQNSEYTWAIDPLDGTVSFVAGLPLYAVSIGLLKNHQPIVGVIYDVSSKNLYFAQKDKGAFLNGKPIKVSRENDLELADVSVDFGHHAKRKQKIEEYIYKVGLKVGYLYAFGPAAGILGLISRGALDGYVSSAYIWDFAAGAIIITEAGGKITDMMGNEPDWSKKRLDLITSNGLIHGKLLEALKR